MLSNSFQCRMNGAGHEWQARLARQFLGGLPRFLLAAEDIDRCGRRLSSSDCSSISGGSRGMSKLSKKHASSE